MKPLQEGIVVPVREALEAEAMFVQISKLNGWESNNVGSYRTERVRRRITDVTTGYRTEHQALVKAFGEERKPTPGEIDLGAHPMDTVFAVVPEKLKEFTAELELLLNKDVTIATTRLALKEFSGVSIKPDMFRAIWKFIEEPPDEN